MEEIGQGGGLLNSSRGGLLSECWEGGSICTCRGARTTSDLSGTYRFRPERWNSGSGFQILGHARRCTGLFVEGAGLSSHRRGFSHYQSSRMGHRWRRRGSLLRRYGELCNEFGWCATCMVWQWWERRRCIAGLLCCRVGRHHRSECLQITRLDICAHLISGFSLC